MKINATVDDRKLQQKIDQQIREQPRQIKIVLGRTAEFLMGLIKQRTQRGKSADGSAFAPYSTKSYFFNVGSKNRPIYKTLDGGYKEFRRYKGKQTNVVDLNFSGNMLSNMTQKSDSTKAIIYFASKAQAIKAVSNNKKRTFFAIGNRETTTLINFFAKEFKKVNKLL
jgi:hypothetical protein